MKNELRTCETCGESYNPILQDDINCEDCHKENIYFLKNVLNKED